MGDLNGQGHSEAVLLAVLIMLVPPFLFAVDIIVKGILEETSAFCRCYREFFKPRDSLGEIPRSVFENQIKFFMYKMFFLYKMFFCIKTSDYLKQPCNALMGTGLVDVSFVLRFLL